MTTEQYREPTGWHVCVHTYLHKLFTGFPVKMGFLFLQVLGERGLDDGPNVGDFPNEQINHVDLVQAGRQ